MCWGQQNLLSLLDIGSGPEPMWQYLVPHDTVYTIYYKFVRYGNCLVTWADW